MFRPRAWIQSRDKSGRKRTPYSPAEIQYYSPNRISINAQGPGVLVLADPFYPGWRVTIDGKSATLLEIGGLFRGVSLTSGNHEVTFLFRPTLLFLGFLLQALTFILLAWFQFNKGNR